MMMSTISNYPDPHITFTTAHKSKGREWPQVRVEDDFRPTEDEDGNWIGLTTEEQNLLYVACTRAQLRLEYNPQASKYIQRWMSEAREYDDEPAGQSPDLAGAYIAYATAAYSDAVLGI